MLALPSTAEPLFLSFSVAFTRPTFPRIVPLAVGAILTMGRRTVTAVLRTTGRPAPGHSRTHHRVFSRAAWLLWPLGKVIAAAILDLILPDEPVLVPMDDTTAQHRGKKVYGKGCHHDAVRSTHTPVVWRGGHRWVVLAISVKFPFASRRWALPVLAALYRPKELDEAEGRGRQTAPEPARHLMAVLIYWFPDRRFVFLGDGGYAAHDLARFCHRHRRHATPRWSAASTATRISMDCRNLDRSEAPGGLGPKAPGFRPRRTWFGEAAARRPPSVGRADRNAASNGSAARDTATRPAQDCSPPVGLRPRSPGHPSR